MEEKAKVEFKNLGYESLIIQDCDELQKAKVDYDVNVVVSDFSMACKSCYVTR